MRKSLWSVGAVALAMSVMSAGQNVDARPGYAKVFKDTYPNLAEKADEAKCGVCHFGSKKTDRNDYGVAMSKAFGDIKNCKDDAKIKEVLTKIEAEKSSTEGKTFGDLIKAGELPGKAP